MNDSDSFRAWLEQYEQRRRREDWRTLLWTALLLLVAAILLGGLAVLLPFVIVRGWL